MSVTPFVWSFLFCIAWRLSYHGNNVLDRSCDCCSLLGATADYAFCRRVGVVSMEPRKKDNRINLTEPIAFNVPTVKWSNDNVR